MGVNSKNTIKISVLLITLLCVVLAMSFFNVFDKYTKLIKKSDVEAKIVQSQLTEILVKYDSLRAHQNDFQFVETEDLPKVNPIDGHKQLLLPYNTAIADKITLLKNQINSDKKSISKLKEGIKLNSKTLHQLVRLKERELLTKVNKLKALNVNARGVKILSDLYSKTSAKKIRQIRVCFMLEGNEFIEKGNKKLFIQVVNPVGEVISFKNSFLERGTKKVFFSASMDVNYNQTDTDVCAYVDLEANKTIKGKYTVNVLYNTTKIGSTIFEYN